jgi:hypothetical protein
MRLIRGLFSSPAEATVFLFLGAFGAVIAVIYALTSREPAGILLLGGFAVATGLLGMLLARDPRSRAVRRRARAGAGDPRNGDEGVTERRDAGGRGPAAEGVGGVDRPFLDESGRLPNETFAPLAVGLGAATAATGLIFGPAPVVVGLLPFAWGAWAWLSGASAELEATELDADRVEARSAELAATEDGTPVAATPGRSAGDG